MAAWARQADGLASKRLATSSDLMKWLRSARPSFLSLALPEALTLNPAEGSGNSRLSAESRARPNILTRVVEPGGSVRKYTGVEPSPRRNLSPSLWACTRRSSPTSSERRSDHTLAITVCSSTEGSTP